MNLRRSMWLASTLPLLRCYGGTRRSDQTVGQPLLAVRFCGLPPFRRRFRRRGRLELAYGGPPRVAVLLKLRDFGEMEIVHFHGGDDHFERFFPGCAHGWAHHLDVRKHFEDALVKTEISKAAGDPAVLNQERTVARHSGEDFFVGVYIADVPEPRDQDALVGGTDHFVHR